MDPFALGEESETGERVDVLPAVQRAEWAEACREHGERASVSARPDHALPPGRHELAVLPEELAVGGNDDVRVVESAHAARLTLGGSDHGIDARLLCCGCERVDRRAGDLDRLVVQAGVPATGFGQRLHEHPIREAGNEALRQRHDVGAAPSALFDEGAGLRRGRLTIEPDRRALDGGCAERRGGAHAAEPSVRRATPS